jgi:translation initiation factor IF-3
MAATFLAFRSAALTLAHPHVLRSSFTSSARHLADSKHGHKRNLRNENIPFATVVAVDPETGRLREPCSLTDILSTINRRTHFIELVSTPSGLGSPNPIVKIINSKELREKEKARKLARPKSMMQEKEIQLSWGVAEGDLAHKLEKVRKELERGHRVSLVYARKRGTPLPSPGEMERRLQETVDALADVGREWKARESKGFATVISLQKLQSQNSS